MTLSKSELILSLPTTIFSIVSFFSALYIAISAWLMRKARQKRLKRILHHGGSTRKGIQNSNKSSSRSGANYSNIIDQSSIALFSPSQYECFWERPELITHHIFWMSICDAIFSLWTIISWLPKLLHIHVVDSDTLIICRIFGIIEQFVMSAGVLWYLMIAWCLFSILFFVGTKNALISTNKHFEKTIFLHHFIVWSISLICTLIPLWPLDQYGAFINTTRNDVYINDTECWIKNVTYFLSFYALVGVTLLFAIFLLIYISIRWKCPLIRLCRIKNNNNKKYKYRCGIRFICCPNLCKISKNNYKNHKNQTKKLINTVISNHSHANDDLIFNTPLSNLSPISNMSLTNKSNISQTTNESDNNVLNFSYGYIFGGLNNRLMGNMILRLELFTIVFILIWCGPFSVRLYNYICDCEAPIWATALHHYGISLLGAGNAIVWSRSKNFHSPFYSYKQINQQAQADMDEQFVDHFTKVISNI